LPPPPASTAPTVEVDVAAAPLEAPAATASRAGGGPTSLASREEAGSPETDPVTDIVGLWLNPRLRSGKN
jgi:hypothetical protein